MKKLNELTLTEAIDGLKESKFSSLELVQACLDQIANRDPEIQAYVTINITEALKKAKEADVVIKKHGIKAFDDKPLLGIPYALKDNYNTKDILTTASSNIIKNYVSPYESTVSRKLGEHGAIILGKTNMDAFAHGASTENSDFFTTKNPWNLAKVPGGSSGGSAAA